MSQIILFNKPYDVLSQFTDNQNRPTLADYIRHSSFYPAGRLDRDSEGLLLLTNDGQLQHRISHPKHKLAKTYWVQVDGSINRKTLEKLTKGVVLKDGPTRPCHVVEMDIPPIWRRNPPIRFRADIPVSWLRITLTEGRNRQVRRMLAHVGFPVLRLIRISIGPWTIINAQSEILLKPGEWQMQQIHLPQNSKR